MLLGMWVGLMVAMMLPSSVAGLVDLEAGREVPPTRPGRGSAFSGQVPTVTIGFAESALRDLEAVRVWYAEQGGARCRGETGRGGVPARSGARRPL